MKGMDTMQIRNTFLTFFEERGHMRVSSSSLIPNDPTLLLTNAGMNQFKPYFLGEKPAPYLRATSVQKCFREVDLEEVGKTDRHCTFFEMLGNFSFGDYFKTDASIWAWELMTQGFGLDPDRLWITVLETDDEAADIWQARVGVPPAKILRRTREQGSFWDMHVAGPCGPCSELLYDRGPDFGVEYDGTNELDEERYLEIWNLVFMELMQNDDREVVGELPSKNIDTGMGLERLAAVVQDVPNNFETDLLSKVVRTAGQVTGHSYGSSPESDVSLRVLADHGRGMTFLIADGVLPGNVGRGYILRRLIRRAVRYARLIAVDKPILSEIVSKVIELYADAYPELGRQSGLIVKVASKEEQRFDDTLRQGLGLLENELKQVRSSGSKTVPGDLVFKLHDTYGFPLDLTMDIAHDEGLQVDEEQFRELMSQQKQRARSARGGKAAVGDRSDVFGPLLEALGRTEFVGYEHLAADTEVRAIVRGSNSVASVEEGEEAEVLLAVTPFYPEGGGQVGDRGVIRTEGGVFEVHDTRRAMPGLFIHTGKVAQGVVARGDNAAAEVDRPWRDGVRRSHTATHMLHWALREQLGEHAKQQGSLVEPGRLRFDFSHFERVDEGRLAEIERTINQRVLTDDPVRAFETTFDYATSIGAMALFGEKYGDNVRVVEVADYSKELCGGTHVAHTGQIGVIKLVHEGSVAAGVRRVEALTGLEGLDHLNMQVATLNAIGKLLKVEPDAIYERVEKTLEAIKSLEATLAKQKHAGQQDDIARIASSEDVISIGTSKLVSHRFDGVEVDSLRKLATGLGAKIGSGVVALGSSGQGKANLVVSVSKDLLEFVSAADLVSVGASALGGRGGGKPELAVGGGPDANALAGAMKLITDSARAALSRP
ncbi:MAG: alanine--tRNA ligase [Actinomycetota bacterium]